MITRNNVKSVLQKLGFVDNGKQFAKDFGAFQLGVDFDRQELVYPEAQGLKINERQTCNFNANENFVVFECVCRLFEKGYKPQHIELEPKWKLGHGASGGRADIWIKDNNGDSLLIIECKTVGNEFENAWKDTLEDGGQLFGYFQQERSTQFLALYASDFVDDEIIFDYKLITVRDNEQYLKSFGKKEVLSFKNADKREKLFKVWAQTYQKDFLTRGLFEKDIPAYSIGKTKYSIADLKEVDSVSIQKKYHEFATILRQHNVSGHENAFDKLVNLFLAKIVDENTNKDELAFYWKGAAYDDVKSLIDRLQKHYKIGMEKFLREDVTYIEKSQIEDAFKFFKTKPDATKEKILLYFDQLKYYTNNDFAFIDVHNEKLFYQNAEVLLKIVRMLQDMRLQTETQNQFLGDLFEGFLDKGVKQSEGQFFTPMPIVKFLISSLPLEKIIRENEDVPQVIDYACGAGHFLNEYANQISPFVKKQYTEKDLTVTVYDPKRINSYYSKITGIEKEYRLSKVAKVSSFMYGQDDINIIYADALAKNAAIKDGTFSVLVANPPYSVKGFLETLDDESLARFELFDNIGDKQKKSCNSIECFFVERAKQLLQPGGVAAIILPSSILSNADGVYVSTREILLKYFDIVAIAEFGSGTFGKTGTNTATLFLRRKDNNPDIAEHYKNRVNAWFSGDFSDDGEYKEQSQELLEKYCQKIKISSDDYKTLLAGVPNEQLLQTEQFAEYLKNFDGQNNKPQHPCDAAKNIYERAKILRNRNLRNPSSSPQEDERQTELKKLRVDYLRACEMEKLYYFILAASVPAPVIIVKSPDANDAVKKFLGYEWSGRKGNEGIKYIGANSATASMDEDELFFKTAGIKQINTPLFNPNDFNDESKINAIIRDNFNGKNTQNAISAVNGEFVFCAELVDMISFDRATFSKSISTTVKKNQAIMSKWEVVKLEEVIELISGQSPESEYYNQNNSGVPFYQGKTEFGEIYLNPPIYWTTKTTKESIKNDILMSVRAPVGPVNINPFEKICIGRGLSALRVSDKIQSKFLFYYLRCNQEIIIGNDGAIFQSISRDQILAIKIPLPPKQIQQKIVSEIEVLEKREASAREATEKLKKDIGEIIDSIKGNHEKLLKICRYSDKRVDCALLTPKNYIGVDNMLQNTMGKTDSNFVPDTGTATEYCIGDILLSNIRPYLKKIWYANSSGGCSNDVLVLQRTDENVDSKYVYYNLKQDNFFDYEMQATKGMKMPRGDKQHILNYTIPLPPLSDQQKIVSKIEKIESKIAEAQMIISEIPPQKADVLRKYLA